MTPPTLSLTVGSTSYRTRVERQVRYAVLAVLRVVGEDGQAPVEPLGVSLDGNRHLAVFEKGDGIVVVAGDPETALANPALPAGFTLRIDAPGYRPGTVAATVPANASLPVSLSALVLRRLPATLQGRVVTASTGLPIAGAAISLAPVPALPAGTHLLTLGQALPADIPAGTAARGFALNPVGGPVPIKTAATTAASRETVVMLNDRQNLAAGQILLFGPASRPSLARIAYVSPLPADPTEAGQVILATPLTASLRREDPVQAFALGAPSGVAAATIGDAFAGESVLVTDAPVSGAAILVGPPATGQPMTGPAVSDADGRYRISGLARFARFDLTASAAGFAAQTLGWVRGAAEREQIDWRLSP